MKFPRKFKTAKRLTHAAGLLALLAALDAQAVTGVWFTATSGQNWGTAINWQGGLIPDGAGQLADFTAVNITGVTTVNLDSSRTLGGFLIEDKAVPSHSWIFSSTNGSGFTLDSGGTDKPFFATSDSLRFPFYARFRVPLTGSRGLVKNQGLGRLWLDADNTALTGGVRVEKGTLRITQPLALGPGPLTIQAVGQPNVNINWQSLDLGPDLTDPVNPVGLTLANNIEIGPFVGPSSGAISATDAAENLVTRLTGIITVFDSGPTTGLFTGPTAVGSRLDVQGAVLAGDLIVKTQTQTIDAGNVRLSGGGTIPNWRNNGHLSLGADEGLSGTGLVTLSNAESKPATFDLNGHDLILSSLSEGKERSSVVNSDNVNRSVFTLDTPTEVTYADSLSGNLSLVKRGAGTFVLASRETPSVISNIVTTTDPLTSDPEVVNLQNGDTLGLAPGQLIVGTPLNTQTTVGSNVITVTDALALKVGMTVSGPNVAVGSVITNISGNIVTLNLPATTTANVESHYFSPFPIGTTIVAIPNRTQFVVSAPALVASLATVGGLDELTPFSVQVPSLHAYTGPTILNGGIMSISTVSNASFPGGLGNVPTVGPEYLVFEGGELLYSNAKDGTTNRGFTIRDGVDAIFNVQASKTNLTFGGDSPFSLGGLRKIGGGILTLSGDHLYTGDTNVDAGTLALASSGSLSVASDITVHSNATFAAAGSVGSVLVKDGATLEIGSVALAQTLTATDVTLQPASSMRFGFSGGASHDKLIVTTPGGLVIQGGNLYAYQQGSVNTYFTPGQYAIIDYAGTFGGSLESIRIRDSAPGYTYELLDRPATTDIVLAIGPILNRSWALTGGGSWTTPANWGGGNVPDVFGEAAVFGPSLTSPSIVAVNSVVRATGLTFNSPRGYTLAGTGSINVNAGAAEIDVKVDGSAGAHRIEVPVNFQSLVRLSTISGSSLTFARDITSSDPAEITGLGTIVFGGQAGFSSVSVENSTLQVGEGGPSGSVTAPLITLTNSAKVVINRSDDSVFSTAVIGPSGSLTHTGAGTTTLSGAGSTYSTLNLRNGTVKLASLDAVPGVGGVMSASLNMEPALVAGLPVSEGTFDLNGLNLILGGAWSGAAGILTDSSSVAGNTIFTYAGGANSTFSGVIKKGTTRTLGLVKTKSSSSLALAGNSDFSGGVTVNNGTVIARHSNALGTGPVLLNVIGPGSSSNFARLVLGNGAVLSNAITLGNQFANGNNAASVAFENSTISAGLSGPITIQTATTNGLTFQGGSIAGRYLTLSGFITAPGRTLLTGGAINFAHSGGGDYAGLEHQSGTIKLGADNALPPTLQLFLAKNNSTTFDLAGFDQTLAQVIRANNNYTSTVTNSVAADPSTLTLNPSSAIIYSGTFAGTLSLVKAAGSADITLTGANIHTGVTRVGSGLLTLTGGGRLSQSKVMLENGATFSSSLITGAPALLLGGGLGGTGSVESTGIGVTVGSSFEPAGLTITTSTLVLNSAATSFYDIAGASIYDTLAVNGPMTNAGALRITVGSGFSLFTGRTFNLASATGGITVGYSSVRLNGVAFTEVGTSGVWNSTALISGRSYSYSETTGQLTVTAGDSTSLLDDWMATNIPDPAQRTLTADPDGDGLSNLLEYATRGDPMVADPLNATLGQNGDRLTLTYSRRADSALIYTVQGTDDLALVWDTVTPPTLPSNNPLPGTANDQVTVTDSDLISDNPRRFLRLNVDYTAP